MTLPVPPDKTEKPEKTKLVTLPEKKKKRGGYKQKECPYCKAVVGNLPNHITLKHPNEAATKAVEITKADIVSGKVKVSPPGEKIIYACLNCKAEVRKGEGICWNCGEALNWEGI